MAWGVTPRCEYTRRSGALRDAIVASDAAGLELALVDVAQHGLGIDPEAVTT